MFGFVGYIVHANGCTPARGTLTLAPPPRALILTPPPWPSASPYPLPPARIHWPWKGPWESIPTDVSPQEAWDLTPEVRGGVGVRGRGKGRGRGRRRHRRLAAYTVYTVLPYLNGPIGDQLALP